VVMGVARAEVASGWPVPPNLVRRLPQVVAEAFVSY
jgi:hypothetical protein